MTEKGHFHDSPILRYITQDYGRLSVRQTSNILSTTQNKTLYSSTNHQMSNLNYSTLVHRAPTYGTSSLFLTDYDKHEWLGSGQRCLALGNIVGNVCKESLAFNEAKSGELSLFQYSAPLLHEVNRMKDQKPPFHSGDSAARHLNSVDNENMEPHRTRSKDSSTKNRCLSTRAQLTETPQVTPLRQQPKLINRTESHYQKKLTGRQAPATRLALENSTQPECNAVHRDLAPDLGIANEPSFDTRAKIFDDAPSRYLKIMNAPQDISIWKVREAMRVYGDLKGIFATFLKSNGILFLEFFDIRHAIVASRHLQLNAVFNRTSIGVEFCPKGIFSQAMQEIPKVENEGILRLSMTNPRLSDGDILHLLDSYGDIRSFQIESDGWPPTVIVEYYDTRNAAFAKAVIQELQVRKRIVCQVSFYQRDWFNLPVRQIPPQLHSNALSQGDTDEASAATKGHSPSNWHHSFYTYHEVESFVSDSPSDQSCRNFSMQDGITHSVHVSTSTIPQKLEVENKPLETETTDGNNSPSLLESMPRDINPSDTPEEDSQSSSSTPETRATVPEVASNVTTASSGDTDTKRALIPIQSVVVDNRTTYMIRNIPNKYTQQMLVEWVNGTHFGMYDFLYLRMDFKNKCNVGYAFINFTDTSVVESFVKEHVGKKWMKFNSDKICRLSYAAIQGRDALIEKFRDSSVMNEDPSYRPKIFYTSGSEIGQEEPFPEPTVRGGISSPMRRRINGRHNNS